jgi:hypothetical protein
MVLLYRKKRTVVQFDISYYDDPKIKSTIRRFAASCRRIVRRYDTSNNIVVYLKEKQHTIETKLLKIGRGNIDDAFRTADFADMLDPIFYACKGEFPAVLYKPRVMQVLINVIRDETKMGAILVVMCDMNIKSHAKQLYSHFARLSRQIEAIDKNLQTNLMFYTKPRAWKESPEYVVSHMRMLS